MTTSVENFTGGIEVEIPKIDSELKKLWADGGGAMTRASLVNLAVYTEGVEAMEPNTALISRITEDHACRAILIVSDAGQTPGKVQAWISAHCHVSRAGAKQVCSEQITFLLPAEAHSLIPNIVFSHLDSDLPLYLWWQAEFPTDEDMQLLTWVDRLIVDSHQWDDCRQSLKDLPNRIDTLPERTTFRDMNWTRTLALRQMLARVFDHPNSIAELPKIQSVELRHAPGHGSTAALVAGWLATQLGWQMKATTATMSNGNQIPIALAEQDGPAVNGCTLETENASFCVAFDGTSKFLKATVTFRDGRAYSFLGPAGSDDQRTLLDEELGKHSSDRIYTASLRAAAPLLG